MKLWKQFLLTLVLAAAGFLLWANLFSGAVPFLKENGLLWLRLTSGDEVETGGPAGGAPGQRGGFAREALVIVQPASQGVVNDRLTAIGTGQAIRTVTVRPLASGQILSIPVSSGKPVTTGDIILELDSVEERLALEKAELALGNARDRAARVENLLQRRAASEVEMETARNELANAELAHREAGIRLERRTLRAPIAGTLGILLVNAGDYVTTQDDVVTIDDRSEIQIEFFAPERFATQIANGNRITATAIAMPGETFDGEIVTVDNRIDQASRTLRVRARIPNTGERLRPGMSFEIEMRFAGETFPAVDPLAIQWDSNGSYVWRVTEGKAGRVDVAIVQRNPESVLVRADIAPGDRIVTEGVQNVREGGTVRIAGEPPADSKPDNGSGNGNAGTRTGS